MRRVFFLLILLATLSHAESKWDWSEPVQYQENHDPGMIWLADGRQLMVGFQDISWETVDKWPKGKALVIGYRVGQGVVLFDPESTKSLRILDGLRNTHPIDLLVAKCLAAAESTPGSIECYVNGQDQWDAELNRVYKSLLGSLDEKHRAAVRQAQQQWLKFRDAESLAINAIYDRQGSIWRIVNTQRSMETIKDRALTLGGYDTGW